MDFWTVPLGPKKKGGRWARQRTAKNGWFSDVNLPGANLQPNQDLNTVQPRFGSLGKLKDKHRELKRHPQAKIPSIPLSQHMASVATYGYRLAYPHLSMFQLVSDLYDYMNHSWCLHHSLSLSSHHHSVSPLKNSRFSWFLFQLSAMSSHGSELPNAWDHW